MKIIKKISINKIHADRERGLNAYDSYLAHRIGKRVVASILYRNVADIFIENKEGSIVEKVYLSSYMFNQSEINYIISNLDKITGKKNKIVIKEIKESLLA